MKTFQQFCEDAYQLNEFNIKSLGGKITRNLGADIAGEGIKTLTKNNPIVSKAVDVATAGVGLGRHAGPAAVGITLGTEVLAPLVKKLAQQRRVAQQARYTSLIPSGNYPYGTGKSAKIVPLKK